MRSQSCNSHGHMTSIALEEYSGMECHICWGLDHRAIGIAGVAQGQLGLTLLEHFVSYGTVPSS
eukprot:2134297-Amphidinium_carterae.1